MAIPVLKIPRTADELADLPHDGNRYELIDGELFVTPAPAREHQRMILALLRHLDPYAKPLGLEVMLSPIDVRASPLTQVEPDVLVLPLHFAGRDEHRWEPMSELLLAIEILSPSTDHVDRGRKRQLYMESGVPEYWIVDLDARAVEVWRPGAQGAEIVSNALVWHPHSVAGAPLHIRVDAVFAEVLGPLAAT